MGRPKVPLISRRRAAEATLRIIDRDGVDGFTIRKLGEELGVNGASLYHHYENKDGIFEDAARLLISNVEAPSPVEDDFVESAVRSSHDYLDALLARPKAIPLVLMNLPSDGRPKATSNLITGFTRYGVSPQNALWAVETLEALVIGTALVQSSRAYEAFARGTDGTPQEERAFFDMTLRSVIGSVIQSGGGPAR